MKTWDCFGNHALQGYGIFIVQHEICHAVHRQLLRIQRKKAVTNLGVGEGHVLMQHIHGDRILPQVIEQFIHGSNHLRHAEVVAAPIGDAVFSCQMQMLFISVVMLLPVAGLRPWSYP